MKRQERLCRFLPPALLILLALFLYFQGLGRGSLNFWDESLTAQRSLEMGTTGWLTPTFDGRPDFNKPPLCYWFTAAAYRMGGENEGMVRLASTVFGLGCLALVVVLGWRLGGAGAGLAAGFFLLLNGDWMNLTRQGLLDSGLLLGGLGAVALLTRPNPGVWTGAAAGACLAFGTLAKNPGAALMLAIPLVDWLWVKRRQAASRSSALHLRAGNGFESVRCEALEGGAPATPPVFPIRALVACLGVWIILGLGWYLLQFGLHHAEFIRTFYQRNIAQRFVSGLPNKGTGFFFYLIHWAILSPASLLLLALGLVAAGRGRGNARSPILPWAVFTLGLLLMLSVTASKRMVYLVLLYPGAALIAGYAASRAWTAWPRLPVRVALALLLGAGLAVDFGRTYLRTLDYNPDLKRAALRIKAESAADAGILMVRPSGGFMRFYARRAVLDGGPEADQAQLLERIRQVKGPLFVVVPRKPRPVETQLIGQVDHLTGFLALPVWEEGKRFRIYRVND